MTDLVQQAQVCCSVLQCVAVCCMVLQGITGCYSVWLICCSNLRYVAHFHVLQSVAYFVLVCIIPGYCHDSCMSGQREWVGQM